ncbi:uncharacterized protein LOC144134510 [Amblyomma americanum]
MFSHGKLLPGGDSTADCRLRTTDGGLFLAQRGFLSATSPYFRALFAEEYGSPRDVVVSGVKGSALDVLLTFLYTDQLFVSAENVLDVLKAADMLLLDEPRDQCLSLLLRYMAPENCLGLATLTRRYSCPKFTDAVMAYVRQHFDHVWRCSENLRDIPEWLLYDLLCSPELNVSREEDAMEVIARWYSATREEESSTLSDLLRCVRIGCCEPGVADLFRERWPALADTVAFQEEVTKALQLGPCTCSRDPLLMKLREPEKPVPIAPTPNLIPFANAAGAQHLNAAAQKFLALNAVAVAAAALAEAASAAARQAAGPTAGVQGGEPAHHATSMPLTQAYCDVCGLVNPERWLPRLPSELIFVVGGWSKGQPQSTVEAFDHRVNRWFQFKTDGFKPRAYHGLVQWRRRLFVVGGLKLQSYLRSVDSFDLDSCEWHRHSPMHVTRAYVAAAALGDHIYAIGGHTGVERTRTVERYEPLTNQWSMVASLSRRRSDGSACAYKGRLYVSGGFSGTDVLKTVEVYTPSLDCWTSVRSLPSPRCGHRMVEHCGRLYVIGGFDGLRRLEKVLRSDECLPLRWRAVPSMATPRSSFAVTQLGDDLYVIGGFNGTSLVASVERYTPADNSWSEAKPLNAPASAFGACTVRGSEVSRKFSARGAVQPRDAQSTEGGV